MSQAELRKAAVVLMSLPADSAERMVARLEPAEVAAVRFEMAHGDSIGPDEQWSVAREFVAAIPHSTLVDRRNSNIPRPTAEIRPPERTEPFTFLRNSDSRGVWTSLADEHPQTIALVLSHLTSTECAKIIASLDDELARDVTARLATMLPASAEVVDDVARGLERRLARRLRR